MRRGGAYGGTILRLLNSMTIVLHPTFKEQKQQQNTPQHKPQ